MDVILIVMGGLRQANPPRRYYLGVFMRLFQISFENLGCKLGQFALWTDFLNSV